MGRYYNRPGMKSESENLRSRALSKYRNTSMLTHPSKEKTPAQLLVFCFAIILITFFFSYLAYILHTNIVPEKYLLIFNQWDTPHYLKIADHGYRAGGDEQFFIVFFPLYPLLVHIFTYVFREPLLAALCIGNAAYIFSVFYLYRLTLLDFEENIAFRAILYFSLFPSAFSLHMAYTDSTYIACALGCFYAARHSRWKTAAAWGFAAASAKVVGFLIFIPLLVEYFEQKKWKFREASPVIFLFFAPILPFIGHALLSKALQGNAFNFIQFQYTHWGQKLSWPWEGFMSAFKSLPWRSPSEKVTVSFWEMLSGIAAYLFVWVSWKKLRLSYTVYAGIMVVALTSKSFWMSLSRHTLHLFPLYIGLAVLIKKETTHYAFLFFSILFYGLFLGLFIQGKWAF
jgi:hypothetical protein